VICVLTHDPKFDVPVLQVALTTPAAYVGVMGSRRTHEDRLRRLREVGVDEDALARLRSPIGLDLGARTPQETAVSIAAEIVLLRQGGSGAPLRDTDGAIHRPRPHRGLTHRGPKGNAVEFTNEFRVPVDVETAFATLTDLERVAPCLPGAQLEEVDGDTYTGRVKVKVGPMQVTYRGTAEVIEIDPDGKRAAIRAKGKETRGAGTASADVVATLTSEADDVTRVDRGDRPRGHGQAGPVRSWGDGGRRGQDHRHLRRTARAAPRGGRGGRGRQPPRRASPTPPSSHRGGQRRLPRRTGRHRGRTVGHTCSRARGDRHRRSRGRAPDDRADPRP
jgi:carbon monoxide dehydrogenase subunit G